MTALPKLSLRYLRDYLNRQRQQDGTLNAAAGLTHAIEQLNRELRATNALLTKHLRRHLHAVSFAIPTVTSPQPHGHMRTTGRAALRAKPGLNLTADMVCPIHLIISPECDCTFSFTVQQMQQVDEVHSSTFAPGRVAAETPLADPMWWGVLDQERPDFLVEADEVPGKGFVSRPLHGVILGEVVSRHDERVSPYASPGYR